MIKIISTNHLMKKEVVEEMIKHESPDIIGIELCEFRASKIFEDAKKIQSKSNSLLGRITDAIKTKADKEGLDYGSDMKSALNYSIEHNIPSVLVDMPILKIQELFLKIPREEQEGFSKELADFEKESITKQVNDEEVLLQMKERYPIAFEFLINMRNLYIANQILKARIDNPGKKIVIVLGSSHVENVNKLIEIKNGGDK